MAITYLGPSNSLVIPGGPTVTRGGSVGRISKAVREALEARGHQFRDDASGETTAPRRAPQSAAANLGAQGSSAEEAAARAGQPEGEQT